MVFDIIEWPSLLSTLSLLSHGRVKRHGLWNWDILFNSGSKLYCLGNLFNLTKRSTSYSLWIQIICYLFLYLSSSQFLTVHLADWGFSKVKKLLIIPLGTNSIFLSPYFLLSSLTCSFKPCPRSSKRSFCSTLLIYAFLWSISSCNTSLPLPWVYQLLQNNWMAGMR